VQWTNDLVVGPWQAATGTWPTTETVWTAADTSIFSSRYYRVRSE
jgi:hypothetical protein